jgi:hypothetical protein
MATVAEKLQLTLNSKNSIKEALEKNNVSTDGKVFSDYGDLVDKAINSGWPEIVYTVSSSTKYVDIALPYDFKIYLEANDTEVAAGKVYYTLNDTEIKDTEIHLAKANSSISYAYPYPGVGGYLHITRA